MAERAVVLAGGFATRLRPLSYTKPKPLFPVLGRPVLDWMVEKAMEVAPVAISARYLASAIREHVAARWRGVEVVEEDRPLGDGGAVVNVARALGLSGPLVVANGDVFTDISVRAVWEFHRRMGGAATLALVQVPQEEVGRFGIAQVDDGWRVKGFVEKPREPPGSRLANAGIYVFEPEALREFPEPDGEVKIAKHVLPRLVEKYDVYGYVHGGLWFDIGTHQDYLKANQAALDALCGGCAPQVPGVKVTPPVYLAEGAQVAEGAWVGPHVVLGPGSRVGHGARVKSSVLMAGARVEPHAYVSGSILGEGAVVGRWARVVDAVVADGVYIRDEVHVARGACIGPNREVESDVEEGQVLP